MSSDKFDLIVIGAGPGGYVAAIRAAQHGLRVVCVEKRATLGGTCLNVGCIPSKSLLHATHLYQQARSGHLARFGITLPDVGLDLNAMRAEKDKAVTELTGGIQGLFARNKVERVQGTARLAGDGRVAVTLAAGGGRVLAAKDILIATGSDVSPLPGVAPDGDRIITSTEALELVSIPEHLVVLGAGFIGLEIGSIYSRLGSAVTVLEMADRIAPGLDAELAQAAQRLLIRQGLKFVTGTKLISVEKTTAGLILEIAPVAGGAGERITADRLLLAAGRRPYTAGLGLETVGITPDARGRIPVDHDFRTSVPGLWAIGDVVDGPMLAHKAEEEGIACADTIAGRTGFVDHALIPSVMYTDPEVASVGRNEEELKAAGIAYTVGKFPFAANSRAKANRETDGFVKLLAAGQDGRVLGVHIIGTMAGTMIAQATQAMALGANAEDIALTCHAHPTHAETLKEAAMAAFGKPIHL